MDAREGGFRAVTVALGLVCAVALARVVQTLGLRLPLDYNEGWNAYHAAAAIGGGTLYPGADSLFFNNYPPLSFYLFGLAGLVTGDLIVAGRMLSLLAFLALLPTIFAIARRMGCDRAAAGLAALAFAAPMLLFTHYVGINDPQLLGHAVATPTLLLLLREPRRGRTVIAAAALLTIAVFIKHNLLALPLALLLWLVREDRKAALRLVAAGAAFAALGLALCAAAYGAGFFHQMLDPRGYSLAHAVDRLLVWLEMGGVPLALAILLAWAGPRDSHVTLCLVYAGVAIALGAGFGGGTGIDANIMFDANIALALTTALVLDRRPRLRTAAAALCVVPVAVWIAVSARPDWLTPQPRAAVAAVAERDIAFLGRQPGPALCQSLALCQWAGKPPAVDVFMLTEHYKRGRRDEAVLAQLLADRQFGAVQLGSIEPGRSLLPPTLLRTLDAAYRVDHADPLGVFLVPR